MLINNRVIHDVNGTKKDLSIALNDLFALNSQVSIVAAQDKIYLGSDLPFNHRHFQVVTPNADVETKVSMVEIWDGSAWRQAVDVLDQTSIGGKSFAQSGIISWTTDRNQSWSIEDTTEDIPALSTLKIYNLYWVRLTFDVDFVATLSYVGHKFSGDAQLGGQYPDLNRAAIKSAHTPGKTTWDDQSVLAAEEIIRDLRKGGLIKSPAQIQVWEMFSDASVHKTAEIIMISFGEKYEDNRQVARDRYDLAMDQLAIEPAIDEDADGHNEGVADIASRSWTRR